MFVSKILIQNEIFLSKYMFGILLPKSFWPTVRKNCSSDQESQEFAKFLKSLEQFTQTVKLRSEQYLVT